MTMDERSTSDVEHMRSGAPDQFTESAYEELIGILWKWRKFVVVATGVAAIASVIIALVLPVWYKASTRLLLPEAGGSSLSGALLGDLPSAAKSFLGGTTGNYTRYLAILESRTIHESVAAKHDLVSVYEVEDSGNPLAAAVEVLRSNTEFAVDEELEFMSVSVFDKDPQRAADLANSFVDELNETNARLSSLTAANFRRYVEERFQDALASKDSIDVLIAEFQKEYGVYDFEIQSQAYFDQVAMLRVSNLEAEIQYEALRNRLGPNNPQVLNYQGVVAAAERKFAEILEGSEVVLPIAQDSIPDVIREYADLRLKLLIQEKTLEVVAPLLEQARFDEQKSFEAVQVVDEAVAPTEKAKPQRAFLCISLTISVFLLSLVFIFAVEWWQRNSFKLERAIRLSR